MENQTQKPHLSWSQISTFIMCGRRWWYDKIVRAPRVTSSALFFGSRAHDAEEFNYRQKIQSDQDLPISDVQDAFVDIWEKKLGDEEVMFAPGETADGMKDLGVAVIGEHMRRIAPDIHPLYVEYPPRQGADTQRISLGDNFPFTLQAHLDIVERDPLHPERPFGFSDHKHYAAKKMSRIDMDIDGDDQYTLYALVYRLLFKEDERSIHSNVVSKGKVPTARRVPTSRSNERVRWLIGMMEQIGAAMVNEVYIPNDKGWWCSDKWCDYYADCKINQTWRNPGLHYPHLASK